MTGDVLLLLLGGLVVGPASWWIQQGTARQRRRVELVADLDLAERLRPTRPEIAGRIDKRIDRALERYEPTRTGPKPLLWTITTAVVLYVGFIVANGVSPAPRWAQLVAGATIAVIANLVGLAVETGARRRGLDAG